jgi:4-amino-4-deoxy-L-arabinose transferase-like glycosyltransferase
VRRAAIRKVAGDPLIILQGVLALLWLALALPHVNTRYSFNWDSSQFERAVQHFDISRDQPHPPGYPLWVLALKGLTPLTGGRANSAQVILALLFTAAALLFFRSLAHRILGDNAGLAASVLLGFSALVCLYAITPLTYAVDLFASCSIGWLAARLWLGEARWAPLAFALAAVTAGFRPSGATLLLPLLSFALWRAWRKQPLYAAAGLFAGAAFWLAWYVPTALLSGGFAALAAIDRNQVIAAARTTSMFFGAPLTVHAHMLADVCIYFALALAGLALPLAAQWRARRPGRTMALPAALLFFALWLCPNLAVICLFHCGEPGYVLLSLPPLVLLGAWLASPVWNRPQWIVAAAVVGLASGYYPYERFINPAVATLPYQLLRASPRLPGLLESSQRQLRELIDSLPGRSEEKLIFCMRQRTEAPNIRTVTYEYSDVAWADFDGPGLRVFAPRGGALSDRLPASVRSVGWLCDGAGLPPALRARFPQTRRLAGNALFSFWARDRTNIPATTP